MRKSVSNIMAAVLAMLVIVAGCSIEAKTNADNAACFCWRPDTLHNAGSHPANIANEGMLAGNTEKLYFISYDDASLYTCGNSGDDLENTGCSARGSINLDDDYIYYLSGKSIYRILKQRTLGGNETILYDEADVWRMALVGDNIFFIAYDGQSNETGILFSMDKDGKNLLKIDTQVLTGYLDFDDENLYFAKRHDNKTGVWDIYEYGISSQSGHKIATINGSPKQVCQNAIVYEFNGRLCLNNLATGETTDIYKAGSNDRLCGEGVNGNMVFYTTVDIENNELTLFAYDMDLQTTFCLGNVGNPGICFVGDSLFTVNVVTGNIEKEVIEDGAAVPLEIIFVHSGIS